MNSFEKPTNADFEAMLEKNTDVEWVEYDTENGKVSYPFWKSVIASGNQTYQDFLKWLESRKTVVLPDNTGVVKPKADFDVNTTTAPTVVHDYKTSIHSKIAELSKAPVLDELDDMTGVVKPKDDVSVNVVEEITASKLEKADMGDQTGVVEPKSDVKVNAVEAFPEADKKVSGDDLTGVVKPDATFGKEPKPLIDNDFSVYEEPVVHMDFTDNMLAKYMKLDIED